MLHFHLTTWFTLTFYTAFKTLDITMCREGSTLPNPQKRQTPPKYLVRLGEHLELWTIKLVLITVSNYLG